MDDLFTFELDMGSGEGCMTEERLEDTIYNCLDFCLLYGKTPHFYLCGDDPIRHPVIWPVLELPRDEGVSFSLLSEPEKTEFEQSRHAKQNPCRNQQFLLSRQGYFICFLIYRSITSTTSPRNMVWGGMRL